jgi:phenylacetate-CoA ligase
LKMRDLYGPALRGYVYEQIGLRGALSRPTLDDWIMKKISGNPFQPDGRRQLNRRELERYQLGMINKTLALAAEKSAFYRSLYGAVQLESLRKLEKLPFTTPEDLKADPYRLLCVHPGEISRIVTLQTSGSTGPSKRIFFTESDLELCTDYFHHGMRNLVDETDLVGILFPFKTPASVGDQLIRGLSRLGVKTEPLFGLSKEEIGCSIESGPITSLAGIPAQIADLARSYPRLSSIKSVLLSADFVSDETRKTIRETWGAEVFEHYGMTEMGLGCAVSCEYQNGYHVREADLYLEIIDPGTGSVLPDGEWGEIAFTTLTRIGMPFIRYRTGDVSRWKTEPCSCGSRLKLLDYIQDRKVTKGRINY